MSSERNKFVEWLRKNGAEVLEPTNPYEYARFVARGGTHVIYEGRRGISANGFALECLEAFEQGKPIGMGFARIGGHANRHKAALIARDGRDCFYCAKPIGDDEMTIEHLVSKHKGGPDHQDNLVLAHQSCNLKAGHAPLIEKIKMYSRARTI